MKENRFPRPEIGNSKAKVVSLLLFMCSFCQKLDLCSSISDEVRVLLKLKERLEWDPHKSSSNWVERDLDNGRVADLNVGTATIRKLLQSDDRIKTKDDDDRLNQMQKNSAPAPAPLPPRPLISSPLPSGASRQDHRTPPASPPQISDSQNIPPAGPPLHPKANNISRTSPPEPKAHNTSRASPRRHTDTRGNDTTNHASPTSTKVARHSHWELYVAIGGAVFLLSLSSIFFVCCRANKVVCVRPWSVGLSGQLRQAFVSGVPSLKRSELEVACEDFSNIIGSLSDCMLYKGTLSSGVEIAVVSTIAKSAKDWRKESETQFRKKISVLSKVNHKNFINLIGYCEEEEPFTRMMVFEYAPNGSLFEHLHIRESEHLDWATRLRIAMGIAYCLECMHQLDPPVILEKLDSSSIYLTDDFAAKIADIEFSNEVKEVVSYSEDTSLPLSQISGAELGVYKFGLLLLEILSGSRIFSEDSGFLVQWPWNYFHGKIPLKELVDPTLELEAVQDEQLTAIFDVILLCISPYEERRPTMSEVSGKLREITKITPDGAAPKLSPLWWAELEIASAETSQ